MTVLQNSTAIGFGITTPFLGDGGVPPYTYAVAPGGVGGTIGALTGIYTAPENTEGNDTIVVTDSAVIPVVVNATITVLSSLKLFMDVLKKELALTDDQIFLFDQKFENPNDSRLYIAVGVLTCKPFSNSNQSVSVGANLTEVQSTNFRAILSIDIQSRSTAALMRKEEVILALNSTYAKQQMELNGFYIAPQSSAFVNLSELDGAAIPYRFNISVTIQYAVTKTKVIPFYNDFFDLADQPEVITDP